MMNNRFRYMGWVTLVFTFLMMIWGNLVSSTGSGLACPDWPLCYGTLLPPATPGIVFEWGHRVLAGISSLLILGMLIQALGPASRSNPTLRRAGFFLAALIGFQILLGGATVLVGLSVALSTFHLLIGSIVLAGVITLASVLTWGSNVADRSSQATSRNRVRRVGIAMLFALLIQLALGALVRHSHAGLACPDFPNCADNFLPTPLTWWTFLAFSHRWWGVLLLGGCFQLFLTSRRVSSNLRRPATIALALVIVQIVLGVLTVTTGLGLHVRATHAAIGYALWAVVFFTTLRAGGMRWLWQSNAETRAPYGYLAS